MWMKKKESIKAFDPVKCSCPFFFWATHLPLVFARASWVVPAPNLPSLTKDAIGPPRICKASFSLFWRRRRYVFGKSGRLFVFFVRVRGLSSFPFFLHVIQFISQGFDQGFFSDRLEWQDSSATDVVVRPSGRSFPKWGPPTIVPCKIASAD